VPAVAALGRLGQGRKEKSLFLKTKLLIINIFSDLLLIALEA
jgi:hypothetical protein